MCHIEFFVLMIRLRGTFCENVQKQANSPGVTSFWVSTCIKESLTFVDQQTFFFIFLHEHFLDYENACLRMHLLVEIHNTYQTI